MLRIQHWIWIIVIVWKKYLLILLVLRCLYYRGIIYWKGRLLLLINQLSWSESQKWGIKISFWKFLPFLLLFKRILLMLIKWGCKREITVVFLLLLGWPSFLSKPTIQSKVENGNKNLMLKLNVLHYTQHLNI